MKSLLFMAIALLTHLAVFAQEVQPVGETPVEKEEPKIPWTLAEAHAELERLLSTEELAKIDAMKTEDEMSDFHCGLGMGIRSSWGLWGNSQLAKHMQSLGFIHPDDMSAVILETLWCKRHRKRFRLVERAAFYKAFWKEKEWPGDDVVDPEDKSEVSWSMAFSAEGRPHRMIFVGKSKKTGRRLVFEHPVGIYVPDKKLLSRIVEMEGADPFGLRSLQSTPKGEQDGARQPATAVDSKAE